MADLLIVAISALITFVLPVNNSPIQESYQFIGYCCIIATYALSNLITGSYKCIVRFSLTNDMFKATLFVFVSTAILCGINIIFSLFSSSHSLLISTPTILITGCTSLCAMMLIRVFVKYFYNIISNTNHKRESVIVLGSAINSLSLANSLKNEINGEFDPVALLSLNKDQKYKQVNGMPIEIFDEDNIEFIFNKYKTQTLIFLQNHLELMRSGFADIFLQKNIHLRILNQVEEFDMNQQNEANISGHVKQIKIEDLLGRPEIKNKNPQISNQIKNKTILITGAAGSIGSEIVRQVAQFQAKEIILLDQAETPMHNMQLEMQEKFPNVKIHLYIADISDYQRIEKVFKKFQPELVYHAAAYKHVPMMENNPTEAIRTNVLGTKNLADLSVKYNTHKFVMVSTDKAVNPTNIMGASKRIAEIYVQSLFYNIQRNNEEDKTKFITTRFGNVLGSNGSVIPLFRQQIENGGPLTVTHKDIIRYFMTIQEACSLVLEAGCMGNGGEIYIFDMGKPIKIYDLAKRMILLAGLKPDEDIKIIETGLRPGEKLYEELLNDKEKTTSTSNSKIMIAKVRKYDFNEVQYRINNTIELANDGNIHDMVKLMKEIIPEFISNNSIFQSIDNELNNNNNK